MARRQFVTFYLGEDLFGLDIILVREIHRNLDIAPVDRAPGFIRGLLNLRGQIVTVMDLGTRLGLGARELGRKANCIIMKTGVELRRTGMQDAIHAPATKDLTGLLVDNIGDVIGAESDDIESPPVHASGVEGRYLEGVIKLEKGLLVTLRMSEVLEVEETMVK